MPNAKPLTYVAQCGPRYWGNDTMLRYFQGPGVIATKPLAYGNNCKSSFNSRFTVLAIDSIQSVEKIVEHPFQKMMKWKTLFEMTFVETKTTFVETHLT
ncbi:hypothetical protein TNCV_4619831 [Trichonephila clavipes]|nr:hypothetical protein TNCV_4619831 [Trichonephila clavipes]